MSDKIKLSIEDQAILHKLNNDQLRFLLELDEHKDNRVFIEIINLLIDREKEISFQKSIRDYNPQKIYGLHAMSQGIVTAYVNFFHLVKGARLELDRRSKESKK